MVQFFLSIYLLYNLHLWNIRASNSYIYTIQGVSSKFTGSQHTMYYYEKVNLDETPCMRMTVC